MTADRKLRALFLAAIVVASTMVAFVPASAGAAAAANTSVGLTQGPGTTTSDGVNKTSRQVKISSDTNLTFDNGTNYQFVFTNDDSGNSVTLTVNGSFTLTTDEGLAFMLYAPDGSASFHPQLWHLDGSDGTFYNVTVESGSIPSASGLTNFSVELQDNKGNSLGATESKPSIVGYTGLLAQNSTEGDVRLSVPRDVVPERSSVTLRFNDTSHSMGYEASSDSFVTTIDADLYEANNYSYRVTYTVDGFQALQIGSFANRSSAVNITSAKTTPEFSLSQQPGTTTGDSLNTTRQVTLTTETNLTFDGRYHLEFTNEDTGNSVVLEPDESFTLSDTGRLSFMLYDADGTPRTDNPRLWHIERDGGSEFLSATVVSGSVPAADGTTNFSVTLLDASDGTELASTSTRPSVVGYSGLLEQNSTDGMVELSIPRDAVPKSANASVVISENELHDGSERFEIPMTYNPATDAFEATVNASEFNPNKYAWQVYFSKDGWQIIQVRSPGSANEFVKLNNVSVAGTVTLADGSAAGGHTVGFVSDEGNDSSVLTDTSGAYGTSVEPATPYEVGVVQADVRQDGWTLPKDDTVDFWPVARDSGTSDTDTADIPLPVGHTLNVTVVSAHTGEPIENASVRVFKSNNGARLGIDGNTTAAGVWDPPTEGAGLETNGTVEVEVVAPAGSLYEDNATNVTVTGDRNVTVALDGPANVVGGVEYTNGSAANGTVNSIGERFLNMDLDANGKYDTADHADDLPSPGSYPFAYVQVFEDEPFRSFGPDDGNPDVAYLTTVTDPEVGTTDAGTETLDSAHEVNVTVVDRNGDPVEGATFQTLARSPNGVLAGGWAEWNATTADGLVHLRGKNAPGVELVGDYRLAVTGPFNSTKYASSLNTTNVTVSGDRSLTLTVEETDVAPESHDYGSVTVDDSETVTVTITNDGDFPFEAGGTTIVGSNAGQFTVVAGGGNFTLNPGEHRNVTVEFQPGSEGSKSASLRFDNPGETVAPPLTVPLSGSGQSVAAATPTPTPTPTATSTVTDTPTATSTDTPEPTDTPTDSPTPTATSTDTPAPTPTDSPTPDANAGGTDTPAPTETPTETDSPGFGVAAALVALGAALALLRRRD